MSDQSAELDPNKKHRHDIGAVDHGPESTERTTRSIQVVMATAILFSIALLFWAMLAGWFEISA